MNKELPRVSPRTEREARAFVRDVSPSLRCAVLVRGIAPTAVVVDRRAGCFEIASPCVRAERVDGLLGECRVKPLVVAEDDLLRASVNVEVRCSFREIPRRGKRLVADPAHA